MVLDDGELVAAEAARGRDVRLRADAALEAVGRAPAGLIVVTAGEEAARYMNARLAPEFTLALEQRPEFDALGVSEEPGGIVIFFPVDGGDAKRDIEGVAMPAKTAAWRRRQWYSGPVGR